MDLKTYRAKTMSEALARVKADLGAAAVILHTRTLKEGGVLGIGSKALVEITASGDPRIAQMRAASAKPDVPAPTVANEPRVQLANSVTADVSVSTTAPSTPREGGVREELCQIRSMVQDLIRQNRAAATSVPSEMVDQYTRLISQQVAAELASQIVDRAAVRREESAQYWDAQGRLVSSPSAPPQDLHHRLLDCIASMVPEPLPLAMGVTGRPAVVAFVGPTGVGKTTTIAKLAAHAKIREGRRVGFITIDTYRIAAVEQLKTYAQILEAPLIAVAAPEEMAPAMARMAEMDLVLIDTAGRSQRDEVRIGELSRFLAAARPDQIHLVLAATSREETLREAVASFSTLGQCQLLMTKLDEAVGIGVILNLLQAFDLRLSFLTTGQSVPDDIEPASARRVAELILGATAAPGSAAQSTEAAA